MDGPDIDGIKEQDARRGELKQGPAESEDHRDDAGDAYRIAAQAVLGGYQLFPVVIPVWGLLEVLYHFVGHVTPGVI